MRYEDYGINDLLNVVDVTVEFPKVPRRKVRHDNLMKEHEIRLERNPYTFQYRASAAKKASHAAKKSWKKCEKKRKRIAEKVSGVTIVPDFEAIKSWGELKEMGRLENSDGHVYVSSAYSVEAYDAYDPETDEWIGVTVDTLWEEIREDEPWWDLDLGEDETYYGCGSNSYFLSKDKLLKFGLMKCLVD